MRFASSPIGFYPEEPDKLYRAFANGDGTYISFEEFPILRETPHGVWIDNWQRERFVKTDAKKRFASRTQKEAVDQLFHRYERWAKLLERDKQRCKNALALIAKEREED